MSIKTGIVWCDSTWNGWIGCEGISPACANCYAEAQDKFRHWTAEGWGGPRKRTTSAYWKQPLKWNAAPFHECDGCGWRGDGGTSGAMCPLIDCSGKLSPARRRVFAFSLADVFDNKVPAEWRSDFFELIRRTPNLDWLILTKRIVNAFKGMLPMDFNAVNYCNVWLGATVVNQEEADRDIPKLLAINARVRFLSMEPLLGPVDLTSIHISGHGHHEFDPKIMANVLQRPRQYPTLPQLDWVIAGGESGPGARPSHPDWYRSLRDQCAAAGVPYLFKQWGEWRAAKSVQEATLNPILVSNRKAAYADKPEARDFPCFSGCFHMAHQVESMLDGSGELAKGDCAMFKAGKKAAGRLLDGVEHNGFPM